LALNRSPPPPPFPLLQDQKTAQKSSQRKILSHKASNPPPLVTLHVDGPYLIEEKQKFIKNSSKFLQNLKTFPTKNQ